MEQAILDWLNWLALRCSGETCAGYAFELRSLAKWAAACVPPLACAGDFGATDLTRYLAERRAAGIGAAAIKRSVGALRSFFKWARGEASPAIGLPYPRVPRRVQRTLTGEEALRVLAACDTRTVAGVRDLAIVALMLDSGLRASEVCRLRLADVDLDRRALLVVVKGGQQRFGVFSAYTASLLAAWRAWRPRVARAEADAFFVSLNYGRALTRVGLLCLCRRLARRAGVPHFAPHALRRAFATLAISFGAPTRLVQVAGRWDDLAQVERYTGALDARAFDPYSPVARLIG